MTIHQFQRHSRFDLMQLTLGVLQQSPASAPSVVEALGRKGYFGLSAEGVEQAIDGLRRAGYEIFEDDGVYSVGEGPKGAA